MGPRKRKSITGLKKRPKGPTASRGVAKVKPFAQLEESIQESTLTSCLQVESPIQRPKKSVDGVRSRRPLLVNASSAARTDASFALITCGFLRRHTSRKPLPPLTPLQAQMRYISQTTMHRIWTSFSKPSEESFRKILRRVERSVIGRLPGDMTKIAAQEAIKPVAKILGKRLPRVLFPSSANEAHFDCDGLLRDNRSFKFQLAKSERNIKFLREAIKKEGLAIAAEKAALEKLQAADDSQSNDEQRSNQWDGMPQYNEILDSADQISMSRSEPYRHLTLLDAVEMRKLLGKIREPVVDAHGRKGFDGPPTLNESVLRDKARLVQSFAE